MRWLLAIGGVVLVGVGLGVVVLSMSGMGECGIGCYPGTPGTRLFEERLADEFYYRGNALARQGDYDRAIAEYDEAIKHRPDFVAAFLNRGNAYANKGQYDRALQDIDRAIALMPNYARDDRRLVDRKMGQEKKRAAADPRLCQQVELASSMATCLALIQSRDETRESRARTFFNTRGKRYLEIEQYRRAIQDFDRAIELDPKDAEAFDGRGRAHVAQGENEAAIADYDKAIALKPDPAEAHFGRGIAGFLAGRFEAASADLATSAAARPGGAVDPTLPLWLFLAHARAGAADAGALARAADALDPERWPHPLMSLYLGKASEDEVRAAATHGSDDQRRHQQACEADFFIAEYRLAVRHGADDDREREAIKWLLRKAAASCNLESLVRPAARAEVERLP